jgi:hypothetical protein
VVVADDERPARSFLVALLRSFEDVLVIGEAVSGTEAVALIRHGVRRVRGEGIRSQRRGLPAQTR